MGSDRITIIRGRNDGALEWRSYRRGQSAVVAQGTVASLADPLPEDVAGKRSGSVTIALPASQIVMRIMHFPVLAPEELAGAVALQVDKFSPFPVEQMVFSYEVLAQQGDETAVLIAIAQRSSVASWGDGLRRGGSDVARVDSAALGLWQALLAGGALASERRESLLLVDADEVVLLIHDGGKLLTISGLGQPGDLSDPTVCEDLAEEVSRILMETDAEQGPGMQPCLVLAAIDEGSLGALQVALQQRVDAEVCVGLGGAFPDGVAGVLQRGTAAGITPPPLNLIPPEWVRDSESQLFRKQLIYAGCALLGLWFLLLAVGLGYMAWQRSRLRYLREAEQQWLAPANAVRSMRLQANLVDRYRDRRHSALECLREISSIQPEGVDLISFTYRKGDGIELVGEADSGELVLAFNQRLNESELFEDVRPGTRTRTRQGRHRFSFELMFGGAQ